MESRLQSENPVDNREFVTLDCLGIGRYVLPPCCINVSDGWQGVVSAARAKDDKRCWRAEAF